MAAFSESQAAAFEAYKRGESFFLTGDAGTGKTELIKAMVEYSSKRKVAVTATTGIAAVSIGGRTIHSFLKIFPDDVNLTKEEIATRNAKNTWYVKYVQKHTTLIIDEVSMLDVDLFEKADWVLKVYMRNPKAFGGLQVILAGDFFQLPPVYKAHGRPRFIFQLPLFYDVCTTRHELLTVFRQDDVAFVALLRRMRRNIMTENDHAVLESRLHADISIDGIQPTKLFSRNIDVDSVNAGALGALDGDVKEYVSKSEVNALQDFKKDALERVQSKFDKDFSVGTLSLKVGAQVLLTYNVDVSSGLCNGSRGVVLEVDEVPKVRFLTHTRKTVDLDVEPIRFSRTDRDAGMEIFAWMIPLRLAWATTIHKSQGLSLDCVEVCMDSSLFEEGQAYVAISRARSLSGLSLSKYTRDVVRANASVKEFYATPMSILKVRYEKNF